MGDNTIENVSEFVYLGSLLTAYNDCSKEINRRIAKATGIMAEFKNVWKSKSISVKTKLDIIRTCVLSVLLYACETWTLRKRDKDRLLAFEMRCYRRILNIRWQQKITNEEIRGRIGNITNIVQLVIRRKLRFFGHICRMDDKRLVKNVVFGRMEGTSRKGRPCREWLDDISEWCQEKIDVLQRKAQDRDLWRMTVAYALDTNGQ